MSTNSSSLAPTLYEESRALSQAPFQFLGYALAFPSDSGVHVHMARRHRVLNFMTTWPPDIRHCTTYGPCDSPGSTTPGEPWSLRPLRLEAKTFDTTRKLRHPLHADLTNAPMLPAWLALQIFSVLESEVRWAYKE